MRKQLKRGIAVLFGIGMLCSSLTGCKANPQPPKEEKEPVVAVGDAGATLRTATSYEEIYDAFERIPKETNRSSWLNGSAILDFAVAENVKDAAPMESGGVKPESSATSGTGKDFSGTNVQVAGIDEADIVKTDGAFLYILDRINNRISIVSADQSDLRILAEVSLSRDNMGNLRELYLSENRLVVVTERENAQEVTRHFGEKDYENLGEPDYVKYNVWKSQVGLLTFDITERNNPKLLSDLWQDGTYLSSRCVGGYVYTFSDYNGRNYYDMYSFGGLIEKAEETAGQKKDSADERIPCVNGEVLPPDCIYICDEPNSEEFLVLTAMKISEPSAYADTKTVLSGGDHCYVSNRYIYIGNSRWQNIKFPYNRTELYRFSYENGTVEAAGQVTIKGTLNDQFSMDEYKGKLRIVTTVTEYDYTEQEILDRLDDNNEDGVVDEEDLKGAYEAFWWLQPGYSSTQSNALYIYDEDLTLTGSIEKLAENEHIESARLMGDTGYFVTFRQTDPLFSVDLSDPANPKVLGALKIPGFSEYLHPFGDNLLLGIGYDADERTGWRQGIKVSMFDVSDPANVVEVSKMVFPEYSGSFSTHKDILVDAEKNLIGFPAYGYEYGNEYHVYCVLGYDTEKGFFKKMTEGYTIQWDNFDYNKLKGLTQQCRGMYIDDTFYMIQPSYEIRSFTMDTWEQTGRIVLAKEVDKALEDKERIREIKPEPIVITLDSNPSTGYSWEYRLEGDSIGLSESRFISDEKDTYLCGAGGKEQFTFEVLRRGTTKIIFEYKRSWEDEQVRTIEYTVTVGEDYQAKIEEVIES